MKKPPRVLLKRLMGVSRPKPWRIKFWEDRGENQ
jgi:hypothetical protein